MREDGIPPIRKQIRLVDVAQAAGVSQGTASNVFNRPQIVSEEVRERVKAAARAIGYAGPDVKGRVLRAGKVNAIGVASVQPISHFFEDPFARVLMSGIAEACDARGAGLSLVSTLNQERLAWNIQSALVDGFILFCVEAGPQLVRLTKQRKLPFVALDWLDDESISAVGVDDVAGARRAARHLVELGHRRFAIVTLNVAGRRPGLASRGEIEHAVYHVSRDRLRGYFEVLAEAGIDTESVPILSGELDDDAIRAGLAEIFARPNPPTALLVMSDRFAMTVLDWLAERGLSVPGDVSVIGYDNVPESALTRPPLTTIAQPIKDIGRTAVEIVLDGDGDARRQTLETKLVVRGTTAPPRA